MSNINKDKKDDFENSYSKTRIREGIVAAKKVLTGETKDLVAGANKWGSGDVGKAVKAASQDQSIITKVIQNSGFSNFTTWFYKQKPYTQKGSNTKAENEVKLEKLKIN